MKYLVLFVVVIVGLMLVKKAQQPTRPQAPRKTEPQPPERMLACAHCGAHAPASRCVWRDGKPYCSEEHARLGS